MASSGGCEHYVIAVEVKKVRAGIYGIYAERFVEGPEELHKSMRFVDL